MSKLYNIQELSDILNIPYSVAMGMLRDGHIPFMLLANRWPMVHKKDIVKLAKTYGLPIDKDALKKGEDDS